MKKKPFDISFKAAIEEGEYKVITRDGRPIRIVCWDQLSDEPILALVKGNPRDKTDPREHPVTYFEGGNYLLNSKSPLDLFLVAAKKGKKPSENAEDQSNNHFSHE